MTPWEAFKKRQEEREKESSDKGTQEVPTENRGNTPWQQYKNRRKEKGLPEIPVVEKAREPVKLPKLSYPKPLSAPSGDGYFSYPGEQIQKDRAQLSELYRADNDRFLSGVKGTVAPYYIGAMEEHRASQNPYGGKGYPGLTAKPEPVTDLEAHIEPTEDYYAAAIEYAKHVHPYAERAGKTAQAAEKYEDSVGEIHEVWKSRVRIPKEVQAELDLLMGKTHITGENGGRGGYFGVSEDRLKLLEEEKAVAQYFEADAELQKMEAYDLDTGRQKIDDLNRLIEISASGKKDSYDDPSVNRHNRREQQKLMAKYGLSSEDDVAAILAEENAMYHRVKWMRDEEKLTQQALNDPNFEKYVSQAKWNPFDLSNRPDKGYIDTLLYTSDVMHNYNGDGTKKESDAALLGMTEDEFKIYKYYLGKGDKETAQGYLDAIQLRRNAKRGERLAAQEREAGTLHQLGFSMGAGVDNFLSGMSGIGDVLRGREEYKPYSAMQYAGGEIREDLGDTGPKWVGKTLQGVYDAGSTISNMAPSILASVAVGHLNPALGAATGKALLGSSAAGSAYQDKINAGFDSESARSYGVMIGISEVALESLLGGISQLGGSVLKNSAIKALNSVDNVLARFSKTAAGKLILSGASEGLEEGLQSVIEPYLWQAVSGVEADVDWQEALYNSLLGFVTGSVFEAPSAVQTAVVNHDAQKTYGANPGTLIEQVLNLDPYNDYALRMKTLLEKGKSFSGAQLNQLAEIKGEATKKQQGARAQSFFETKLTEYGETGNIKAISTALGKLATGEAISRAERKAISKSQYAQRAAQDYFASSAKANGQQNVTGATESAQPSLPDTAPKATTAKITGVDETNNPKLSEDAGARVGKVTQAAFEPTADGKTHLAEGGEAVTIRGVAKVETGKERNQVYLEVVDEDGHKSVVPGDSLDYGSRDEMLLYEGFGQLGISAKYFPEFLAGFRHQQEMGKDTGTDMSIAEYALYFEEAVFYGRHNMEGALARSVLLQDARNTAYAAGQDSRSQIKKQSNQQEAAVATAKKSGQGKVHKKGQVHYSDNMPLKLSKFQRAGVKVAEKLASFGLEVHVYRSTLNEQGQWINDRGEASPNGYYVLEDGSIHVDLNAGAGGRGLVVYTLSHEIVHFMARHNPEGFETLADLLVKWYEGKGVNVEDLIRDRMEEHGYSREVAFEEVVAHSCESFLTDSDILIKLTELKQKHSKIYNQIRETVLKFVEWMRKLFRDIDPDSQEGRMLHEARGTIDHIYEAFTSGMSGAIDTYQWIGAQKNTTDEGGVMYSRGGRKDKVAEHMKEITEADISVLQAMGARTSISQLSHEQLKAVKKWAYRFYKRMGNRSPFFRAWFGDWRSADTNGVKWVEISKKEYSTRRREVKSVELGGNVIVETDLFNDSLHYAIKNGDKAAIEKLLSHIDELIKNGVLLDTWISGRTSGNKKGTTQFMHYLYCPVEYNGAPFLAKITVEEYDVNGKQRAYNAQRIKMLALPRAHFAQLNKQAKTRNMRLQANEIMVAQLFDLVKQFDGNFKSCNNDSAQASKIVNPDGTPMVVYHQTQNDFSVFDTHHTGAGTSDYVTPFGIFLKPERNDIGIGGNIQMPLYASIKRPLTVANRSELLTYLRKDKRYNALYEEIKNRTPIYEAKLEAAQKAIQDYISQWEKDNPTANSRDLYHIDEFNELSDKEDELVDEWERLNAETAERAKNRIVEYLKRRGYDGVIIEHDQGSYGRGTKAIIAFDSTQVKSATDNVGTFSKVNPDIYFSQRSRDSLQSALMAMEPALVENRGEQKLLERYQADSKKRSAEVQRQQKMEAELAQLEASEIPNESKIKALKERLIRSYNLTEALDQRMIAAEARLRSLAEGKGRLGKTANADLLTMSPEALRDRVAQVEQQLADSYGRQDELTQQRDHAKAQSHRSTGTRVDRNGLFTFVRDLMRKNGAESLATDRVKAKTDELGVIFDKAAEIYDRLGAKAADTYLLLSVESFTRDLTDSGTVVTDTVALDIMAEAKRLMEGSRMQTVMDRVTARYEELLQQKDQRLEEQKRKARENEEKIVTKYQEARTKSADSRKKTAIKSKIRKSLKELNSLLTHGNKKKNVKNGMQDVAASLLAYGDVLFSHESQIAPETMVRNGIMTDLTDAESDALNKYADLLQKRDDYEKRIAAVRQYRRGDWVTKEKDLQEMVDFVNGKLEKATKDLSSVFERERARMNKVTFSAILSELTASYKALENAQDEYIRGAYISYVYDRLVAMKDQGTPVKDMSLAQLTELHDAVKMVMTTIKNANRLFREGKAETLSQMVDRVQTEIRALYRKEADPKAVAGKVKQFVRSFVWNELKPYYAFDRIGSEGLMELFWDVIKAEGNYGLEISEAGVFVENLRKEHGYKDWDMDTVSVFHTDNGMDFKVTLGDMMSIYAYSRRDQAFKHMTSGGFVFNPGQEYKDGEKKLFGKRMRSTEIETYRMTEDLLLEIINTLTPEQRAYAEAMQDYLTQLGEKGNEVSRQMYGIDLFKEKFYFPLKSSADFRSSAEQQLGATPTTASLVNTGMTKETVPNASNPIVLERFDDVAIRHIDQMLKYHNYVLPIENMRKVMDYTQLTDGEWDTSVKRLIKAVYGQEANAYLEQWITDLNGGASESGAQNPLAQFFARSKKVSVAGNLSVVVQQYFAVTRAAAEIDPKYFVPLKGSDASKSEQRQWDELKQWAGLAVIKEMGGFDMGSARTTQDYLGKTETKTNLKEKVDNAMMWGASKMDEIGWSSIWRAVKKEVADKQGLQPGTEEFFKAAGQRFTEVIVKTQVYDSVTARSGFMRSKRDSVKYLVSFLGEPTTIVNMMFSAQVQLYRAQRSGDAAAMKQARGRIGRTSAVLILSSVLGSLAKSLVYAMRDDEETEAFLERYWKQFGMALRSDMNPLNMIPIGRDIMSLLDGWDIERPDMGLLNDFITALKRAIRGDKPMENWTNFTMTVFNLIGVPVKNVVRDGKAFVRLYGDITDDIKPEESGASFYRGLAGKDRSKDEILYEAVVNGNAGKVQQIRRGYADNGKYTTALRKALRTCDPRIQEAALARYEGDITGYMNIAKEILAERHFVQDDIVSAIMTEVSNIKTEREGKAPSQPSTPAMYTGEDYMASVLDEPETAEAVREYIIDRYKSKGKSQAEAESAFYSDIRSEIKGEYDMGAIDYGTAFDYLTDFGGYSENDAYWALDKWDYSQENGGTEGYSKYNDFIYAVETGEGLADMIDLYESKGVEAKDMASQITSHFKPIYIAMSAAERRALKKKLVKAYSALGYDRSDAIDKWLKN